MLDSLSEIPFLPVARKMGDLTPVYLEDEKFSVEEYSLILQCLEKKGIIRIDYDGTLPGADMTAYQGLKVHGSMALTARGQEALDDMEILG